MTRRAFAASLFSSAVYADTLDVDLAHCELRDVEVGKTFLHDGQLYVRMADADRPEELPRDAPTPVEVVRLSGDRLDHAHTVAVLPARCWVKRAAVTVTATKAHWE